MPTENPRPALGRSLQPDTESEKPSAALDLSKKSWDDVSTAARALRDIEGNLSKTEAASPAGDTTFGTKRSGPPRIQRAPKVSTLKIVEEEEDISAALGGGDSGETEGVARSFVSTGYEKTCTGNRRNKRGLVQLT